MRFGGLHISKELLLTADVMNTLNGGLSRPVIHMKREEDKYILKVRIPGVEPNRMRVEVKNNQLFIFHYITLREDDLYDGIHRIPYNIGYVIIPQDVKIPGIKAIFEDHELKILMPFNELANGYHKRIQIDSS